MELIIKITRQDVEKLLKKGRLTADELDIILEIIKDAPPKYDQFP